MIKISYKSNKTILKNILSMFLVVASFQVLGQVNGNKPYKKRVPTVKNSNKDTSIKSTVATVQENYVDTIFLGINKTAFVDIKGMSLVSVNIGAESEDIYISPQEETKVIRLKAGRRNFKETNLTVFTKEASLQFLVRYSDNPPKNMYKYNFDSSIKTTDDDKRITVNNNTVVAANQNQKSQNPVTVTETKKITDSSSSVVIEYGRNSITVDKNNPSNNTAIETKKEVAEKKPEAPENKKVEFKGKYLREEVFEKLRTKAVNINVGDIDGGLRVVIDRIYRDGELYYYSLAVTNRDKMDLKVDYVGFEVHRMGSNAQTNTDIVKSWSASNNPTTIAAGAKVAMIFCTEKIDMTPEEFLFFTLKGKTTEEKNINVKIKSIDYKRTDDLKL